MPKAPQIRSRTEQRNKRTAVRKKATSGRCLDAAHGEAERARGAVQRIAIEGRKEDARTIVGTRHKSGRCPIIAMRPDEVQASRFPVAVARSRRKKQSLEGMRRRGKQFTTLRLSESKDRSRALPSKSKVKPRRGLIQNSELMDSLREFDSTIVILRSRATKNPYSCFFTIPAFQACGPPPAKAAARKRAPNIKPFVILNEVDRRTQRVQRPLADYAEQGGERQTQCSQTSVC